MPETMLPISPSLQIPDVVWQNIATFLNVKDVVRLRLCSHRLYALLAAEIARKPLAWGNARAITQNLRFWQVNKDLAFHVKMLDVSVIPAAGAQEDDIELRVEPTNAEDDTLTIDNLSLAPEPLYPRMLRTMKTFTMLEDLVLRDIRLPVDYPILIHAFPHLRNLEFIYCEVMDDIPTGNVLFTTPASLKRLVMMDMRYPEAILRCTRESRIDSQGSRLMAPLVLLVRSPNLQNLSVDERTAIALTLFLLPFPNILQVLEVGTTVPLRLHSPVDTMTLFRLLMLFPSIISFCTLEKDDPPSVSFENLSRLWDPSALELLQKYQGPLVIASFLVSRGRIPREIVLSTYESPHFLSLSTYTCCASIELPVSKRLANGSRPMASATRSILDITSAFLHKYPGEIKHLSMNRPWSWPDGNDQSSESLPFHAFIGDLTSLSGALKNILNILKLSNLRPREIVIFCEFEDGPFEDMCLALAHNRERLSILEVLRLKKIPGRYTQIFEGILSLPYHFHKLEVDRRFDSLDEFMTYSRFLLEKFPDLVELRIYTPSDDNISWLASPTNPELLDDNGFPILIDWSEIDPPLSPEGELKEILAVWHKLYPKLQVVQLAAWSVWRCDDDGLWVQAEK